MNETNKDNYQIIIIIIIIIITIVIIIIIIIIIITQNKTKTSGESLFFVETDVMEKTADCILPENPI